MNTESDSYYSRLVKEALTMLKQSGFFEGRDWLWQQSCELIAVAATLLLVSDTSVRVLPVFPHGVMSLWEQAARLRVCESKYEITHRQTPLRREAEKLERQINLWDADILIKQIKLLQQSSGTQKRIDVLRNQLALVSMSSSYDVQEKITTLKASLAEVHSALNVLRRDEERTRSFNFSEGTPVRYFQNSDVDAPQDRPYLICEIMGAEDRFEGLEPSRHHRSSCPFGEIPLRTVTQHLVAQGRRGLTLAEGIALVRHFPEKAEGEYHLDLLGSNMSIQNGAHAWIINRGSMSQHTRSAFCHVSCVNRVFF